MNGRERAIPSSPFYLEFGRNAAAVMKEEEGVKGKRRGKSKRWEEGKEKERETAVRQIARALHTRIISILPMWLILVPTDLRYGCRWLRA